MIECSLMKVPGRWLSLVETRVPDIFKIVCPLCPPGLFCEENIDDCAGGPHCLNGGQCVDRIGGYSCRCLPGFAGERCEGDINECLSNPCNSEGSLDCIQLTNNYQCVCRSTFTGEAPRGFWAQIGLCMTCPRPQRSFSCV